MGPHSDLPERVGYPQASPTILTTALSRPESPIPVPASPTHGRIMEPHPTMIPPPLAHSPPRSPIPIIPSDRYSGPGDLDLADAERERAERFSDLAHQMVEQLHVAEEGENERERIFRSNEDDRQRMYLEHEARRDEEAAHHREEILRDVGDRVEDRLAALPPAPYAPAHFPEEGAPTMPVPEPYLGPAEEIHEDIPMIPPPGPHESRTQTPVSLLPSHPEEIDVDARSIAERIQREVTEATARHTQEILETVRLEREELAAARAEAERLRGELDAERERRIAEMDAQASALREELAGLRAENEQLKNDLEQERQLRISDDEARRENERAEDRQRAEDLTRQLNDVTNIVSQTQDELIRKREQADERWEQKQNWHNDCTSQMDGMKDMFREFQRMFEDEQRVRQAEREAEAAKPSK